MAIMIGNKIVTITITGQEICKLQRKFCVGIADLARKTGITQKRIRHVRERGLDNFYAARDWLHAITGKDPGRLYARDQVAAILERLGI